MVTATYQAASNTAVSKRNKGSRREQLTKLLCRKSGDSIAQIKKAFGWQLHTARAAISTLKKAGAQVERTLTEKGSVYRISARGRIS